MGDGQTYIYDDLIALQAPWLATFGEPMPFGFQIGPNQVPILRQCLAEESQEPLDDFVAADIADGRVY